MVTRGRADDQQLKSLLAGISWQVFQECALFGKPYEILFLGPNAGVISSVGIGLNLLKDLNTVIPEKEDIIIIQGISMPEGYQYVNDDLFQLVKLAEKKGNYLL